MTELDGSMTDRFMGVFRSVGREPIGEARFVGARRHQQRSTKLALTGLVMIGAPVFLTAIALQAPMDNLFGLAILSWCFCPVMGAAFAFTGVRRHLHLRGIRAESEVEVFEGTTPLVRAPGMPNTVYDEVTKRLIRVSVVQPGRAHRVVVHPETGMVIAVDGVLVSRFIGGDVSITARAPAFEPASTARPLGALERHELQQLARRVARTTWSRVLAFGAVAVAAISAAWSVSSKDGWPPELLVVWGVCACLLLIAVLDAIGRRSLSRKALRDGAAGLRRAENGWVLPESGICWDANGIPGPLRLTEGGLGSEADGRARPILF